MREHVERFAPLSPGWRIALAAVGSTVALPTLLFALNSANYAPAHLLLYGLPSLLVLLSSYVLVESVVRRANDAPEPDWWGRKRVTDEREESVSDPDPVDTLKQRYAEGKLSTEEFEERVDRLVERDVVTRDEVDRELDRGLGVERA